MVDVVGHGDLLPRLTLKGQGDADGDVDASDSLRGEGDELVLAPQVDDGLTGMEQETQFGE